MIDTKWKIIKPEKPGDNDLEQMYAYNMYWNASKSMLLYPTSILRKTPFGEYHKGKDGDNKCKLGFVKVMSNGVLNTDIGTNILNLLYIKIEEN